MPSAGRPSLQPAWQLDRKAPLFQRLWPKPPSAVLKKALGALVAVVDDLLAALAQPGTPAALAKAGTASLSAVKADAAKVLGGRVTAEASRAAVGDAADAWKAKADATLADAEGALQRLAAAATLPTWWVDSFFLPPERATKAKPDPDVP